MKDLTTQEGRQSAITAIDNEFVEALRDNGFDISPDAVCHIFPTEIVLGIKLTSDIMEYSSRIDLSVAVKDVLGEKQNRINFGNSGAFTPSSKAAYWRTVHAASILKNWEVACQLINTYCKKNNDLRAEIFEVNK